MKDVDRFDDRTWKRLLAFLVPDEGNMTRSAVEAELQHLGVDTRPGLARIERTLKQVAATREARADLEAAKRRRPSLLAKLRGMASEAGSLPKQHLRRVIRERFSGTAQAAFFRKLESAASEEDLRSLLEDMSTLDALTQDSDDADP